jgi:hypothetical protein
MPVQLYALAWSPEDRLAIENWSRQHEEKVTIIGWSRILLEPLNVAAQDPSIFGLAIDGVVINNHAKHPPDSLKEAVKKLTAGSLKLYAVSNGIEPVTVPEPAQY